MYYSEFSVNYAKYGILKDKKWDLAILPWGATEPHGYHLPYGTDNIISEAIACDAAAIAAKEGVNAMVLPPVPFGPQNRGQVGLPFCIHSSLGTMSCILADVVESLRTQGIHKLMIALGHGGDVYGVKALIRDFSVRYPDFDIVSVEYWNLIEDRLSIFSEPIDDHAGEEETSLIMHYCPESVRMDIAGDGETRPFAIESLNDKTGWLPRVWDKASKDTGIGNPSKASKAKAEKYLSVILPRIAKLIVEFSTKDLY